MKRSEFVEIVNEVADEEHQALVKSFRDVLAQKEENPGTLLAKALAQVVNEMPIVASRVAATIIEKSGFVEFESD